MPSKPGKHGTRYLYHIEYSEEGNPENHHSMRLWAYSKEHVEDLFYSGEDDGWKIDSIRQALG